MHFRSCVLKRFGVASLAIGATAGQPAAAAFADEALVEWIEAERNSAASEAQGTEYDATAWAGADADGDPGWRSADALDAASRSVAAARAAVSALWPRSQDRCEEWIRGLSRDPSAFVRLGAAGALGRVLELAAPVERVEIVCRWTVAEDERERTAIARALAGSVPVFVADLAIPELARDRSPSVRAAVVQAVHAHFAEDPRRYGAILAELSHDPDTTVRDAALQRSVTFG